MSNATNNIADPKNVFETSEPKFVFRKADLKPGDKKYQEVTAVQVDAAYIAANGDRVVTKEQPEGQPIEIGQWVITKTEADGSTQQWTNYDETSPIALAGMGTKFQERYKPVDGKPGFFSPRSVPTPMVELPEGGTLKVSWGEASGGPGSFLAKYGEGDYNIITAKDLVNLGYTGTDDASVAKLAAIAAELGA